VESLGLIDFIVFWLVFALTVIAVVYGNLKKDTDNLLDHLLMGRKLTLPMFTATLVATWYGGIFGVAEIAFNEGIYNFLTQGLFWYACYIIFAIFILPKLQTNKHMTFANLVYSEIGPRAGKWTALLNIGNLLPIAYILSLGKFLELTFGLDLITSMSLGVLIVLCYSLIGGFRSVVYSDLIQFFVMFTSVVLVFVFCFFKFGLTPLESLPDHYFSFTGKGGVGETLMWGLIAFGTLVDPNFYQRSFAAGSRKIARKGIFAATIIWMIFDLSLTFGAMYAASLQGSDYFNFSLMTLPFGLKGFFLAGILATILSTLDSYLFLAGATFAHDVLNRKSIDAQRASVVIIAFVALVCSLFSNGSIKAVWSTLGSISTAALLIPMLFHYFKRNLTERIFLSSSIAGVFATILFQFFPTNIQPIYFGVMASLIVITVMTNLKLNQQ
tara:strand:+ start:1959 stop:3281 length:1323 start_codon:yes stop_codon:yes gene_type:complete